MPGRTVPRQVQVVALLIWFLSKKADLGIAYVLSRDQVYEMSGVDLLSAASVALFLSSWMSERMVRDSLHTGLSTLEDPHRIVADQFLMHSMLMQFVLVQNNKGVAVDLTSLVAKYIRLWTHRPMADMMKRRLARLVWHRGARRRFGVNFRREWGLCFNKFNDARDLTDTQIASKVMMVSNYRKLMKVRSHGFLCCSCFMCTS